MTRRCPFCGRLVSYTDHFPCSYQPDRDPDPLGGMSGDITSSNRTKRITVRLPEALAGEIDDLVEAGAYETRSEAIRSSLFDTFVAIPEQDEQDEADLPIMADGGVDQSADDTERGDGR